MKTISVSLTNRTDFLSEFLRDYLLESGQQRVIIDCMQAYTRAGPEEIKNYIQSFDRVFLINAETPLIIKELAESFDHKKVTFFTTGHMNFEFKHANVVEFENFFNVMKQHYSIDWLAPVLSNLTPLLEKPKFFDALLGLGKPHRNFVYAKIKDQLDEKFIASYYGVQGMLDKNKNFLWPNNTVADIEPVWCSSRQVRYQSNPIRLSHIIPVEIYNQTAYSIVTETYPSNDFVFFTEKTAKCILTQRLFVMFAGAGYLKHLKNLGFQTFDCVIDESYDQETDDNKRWQKAWDQAEYLCSQPQQNILDKIAPIVKHNYNHFVNSQWGVENQIKNLLKHILTR